MKNLKRAFLSIFMIIPFSAFASGGEALLGMELQVTAFLILIVMVLFSRLPYLAKIGLLAVYLWVSFLNFYLLKDLKYGYYLNNEVVANIRFFLPQIFATILVYYLILKKLTKKDIRNLFLQESVSRQDSISKVFGDFIPEKSAEELITELKNARISTRKIDEI